MSSKNFFFVISTLLPSMYVVACIMVCVKIIVKNLLSWRQSKPPNLLKLLLNKQLAYCFASACLPFLRGPHVAGLFWFKTFLYNRLVVDFYETFCNDWLAYCHTSRISRQDNNTFHIDWQDQYKRDILKNLQERDNNYEEILYCLALVKSYL